MSTSHIKLFIFLSISVLLCKALHNPGILISVPYPLHIPFPEIHLPLNLQDLAIEQLQLTNVTLRTLDFSLTLMKDGIKINQTATLISFNWKYRNDHGQGTFVEKNVTLNLGYSLGKRKDNNRLDFVMENIKKSGGKVKVHLGGRIPETIAVEITNLVLNHGSFIFWGFIEKVLKTSINNLVEPLTKKDIKLHCFQRTRIQETMNNQNEDQDCLFISTILVADPLDYENHTVLLINGAPFFTGSKPSYLDPFSSMILTKSQKIQVQLEQDLVNSILKLYLDRFGFQTSFDSMGISGITEINTLQLSSTFPKMVVYDHEPRNVIFDVSIKAATLEFSEILKTAVVNAELYGIVSTQEIGDDWTVKIGVEKEIYMNPITATAEIRVSPYFGKYAADLNLDFISLKGLKADPEDINKKLIDFGPIQRDLAVLLETAKGAINGELSMNIKSFSYGGIDVGLDGRFKNRSFVLYVEI